MDVGKGHSLPILDNMRGHVCVRETIVRVNVRTVIDWESARSPCLRVKLGIILEIDRYHLHYPLIYQHFCGVMPAPDTYHSTGGHSSGTMARPDDQSSSRMCHRFGNNVRETSGSRCGVLEASFDMSLDMN